jgi:hypothetical protein
MTDFRALCQELVELDQAEPGDYANWRQCWNAAIARARAALAQPEPQGPMPEVDDILRLAAIIRRVDGNHDKGAAALAEAILSHPDSRWQHAQPEPQGPTDKELDELFIDIDQGGEALSWRPYARAALARWGHPAIEPVP